MLPLGAAISATSVVSGETVTIKGTNLPLNEDFKVLMGVYGTQGVGRYRGRDIELRRIRRGHQDL